MFRLLFAVSTLALLTACDDSDSGSGVTSQGEFVEQYRGTYVGTRLIDGSAVSYEFTVNDGQFYLTKHLDNNTSVLSVGTYHDQSGEVTFSELDTTCLLNDQTQQCYVEGIATAMVGKALDPDEVSVSDMEGRFENRLGSVMTLVRGDKQVYVELSDCAQYANVVSGNEIQFQPGECFSVATISMLHSESLNQQGDTIYVTSSNRDLAGYWFK
ncbi:hypothetical protein [Vibrio nomapromontoriensis]|uniref:hypothetical protein n=1 Tax=Vibrio nomapromontoriensis TaxID=2910246 RepID=UPI003D132B7D